MHLIYSVPIKDINYPRMELIYDICNRKNTYCTHSICLAQNLRLTNQISTLKNFVFYQQCINLVFPTKKTSQ